ncbi:Regulatory protein, FmdB, putative domain protein [Candidatus Magnetomorum sp. HK-1]|nr:Regulatory protein, FmdB, putative domain protein [Candidatus Magnetomorum sp. HK-1]
MPIYEFYCKQCDKDFELLLFSNEKPFCPDCQTRDVQRLLSACGFISKGSGGETVSASAGTSSCGSCASASCSSCGV